MANNNKLGDVCKVFNNMGIRELEEDRKFDALMEITEKYHKKVGTRDWDYDPDPNEI